MAKPDKKTALIKLKHGRERSVLNRHPWVFSGAVDRIYGEPQAGDLVPIADSSGAVIGFGFYNPNSEIRIRVFEFGDQIPDIDQLLNRLILKAVEWRKFLFNDLTETNAFRLINSDGDGISGLIVDYYAGNLVIEPVAYWLEKYIQNIIEILQSVTLKFFPISSIRIKSELSAYEREKMSLSADEFNSRLNPPDRVIIKENGLFYKVDMENGQKTGFFLDQRENRLLLRGYSRGQRTLNLFSYTGGFTLNALLGGATEVVSVDTSEPALNLLKENIELNKLDASKTMQVVADVKEYLPKLAQEKKLFDLIICDPPPFAKKRAQVENASRAYKDINRRSMALIEKGFLMTFSCSPFVDEKLFRQILFSASVEAKKEVQIIRKLSSAPCHTLSIFHPESEYLTGLLLYIFNR